MIEKHNITYLLNTLQQTQAEKFDHHDYADANLEPQEKANNKQLLHHRYLQLMIAACIWNDKLL